jgi:hypothetical protein
MRGNSSSRISATQENPQTAKPQGSRAVAVLASTVILKRLQEQSLKRQKTPLSV